MPPGSASIDGLLDRVPALAGRPRTVRELPGGLTNRNYHVVTPDGGYVARVWSAGSELLAIDRDCEYRNSVTAAEAGAGAPVIDYRPADGLLVIGYIDGVTFTSEDVAKPGNLTRIAAAVRGLHAGGRFGNDFNMFEIQARYAGVTAEAGMRIPDGYHDLRPQFEAMRAALAVRDEGTVPCNNDLLAANFIDDGQKIWLIDYEYAGNNDACFELGNTVTECDLDESRTEALVAAYFGTPTRALLARVRLQSVVSEYGWALWGAIQAAASPIDHDFLGWGQHRFDKAASTFRSSGFARLLREATGVD